MRETVCTVIFNWNINGGSWVNIPAYGYMWLKKVR